MCSFQVNAQSYEYGANSIAYDLAHPVFHSVNPIQAQADTSLPEPKSVMFKSMMIPGWGQVVNRQIWKVPIIYGLLGGLAGYSIWLNKQYHDYRAAYYNTEYTDMKFGPTPDYLQDTNQQLLKTNRNTFRNRRDMMYVAIVAAYGLNIVDAYVFAHMRSFDVSENLSMNTSLRPSVTAAGTPGVTLSLKFINRTKAR